MWGSSVLCSRRREEDEFSIHSGVRKNFCLDGDVREILDGLGPEPERGPVVFQSCPEDFGWK